MEEVTNETIKSENKAQTIDREPFNDVLDHFDTVQGYQKIKKIDQYPKKIQSGIKIYNLLSLIAIIIITISSLIYSLWNSIHH